jgi:hypothetical protein
VGNALHQITESGFALFYFASTQYIFERDVTVTAALLDLLLGQVLRSGKEFVAQGLRVCHICEFVRRRCHISGDNRRTALHDSRI